MCASPSAASSRPRNASCRCASTRRRPSGCCAATAASSSWAGRSLLDLLDAQNELFQSQLSRTDGEYRLVLSNYELLFTMGGLLEAVGVLIAALPKPKAGSN